MKLLFVIPLLILFCCLIVYHKFDLGNPVIIKFYNLKGEVLKVYLLMQYREITFYFQQETRQ